MLHTFSEFLVGSLSPRLALVLVIAVFLLCGVSFYIIVIKTSHAIKIKKDRDRFYRSLINGAKTKEVEVSKKKNE